MLACPFFGRLEKHRIGRRKMDGGKRPRSASRREDSERTLQSVPICAVDYQRFPRPPPPLRSRSPPRPPPPPRGPPPPPASRGLASLTLMLRPLNSVPSSD